MIAHAHLLRLRADSRSIAFDGQVLYPWAALRPVRYCHATFECYLVALGVDVIPQLDRRVCIILGGLLLPGQSIVVLGGLFLFSAVLCCPGRSFVIVGGYRL